MFCKGAKEEACGINHLRHTEETGGARSIEQAQISALYACQRLTSEGVDNDNDLGHLRRQHLEVDRDLFVIPRSFARP